MLGIDVSKDTLDAALVEASSKQVLWQTRVSNDARGVAVLLKRTSAQVSWVLEPTGRYGLDAVQQARQAGRTVLMAPTRQAKKYMQSHQDRASTDRTSARGLAWFALDRALREYPLKRPAVDQLDQLLGARKGVRRALTSLQARQRDLPYAREPLQASVQALTQQLRVLDQQIARELKSSPVFELAQRLRAVPGVGPVASAAYAARLSSKDFVSPDSFVSYCGLDVCVRQSGKRKGTPGLTRQGDAELRRLAFMCARGAIRAKGSPFVAQYERERAKGLTKTAAQCAVGRKILKVVWSMARHGGQYAPERVYRAPDRAERPDGAERPDRAERRSQEAGAAAEAVVGSA